MKKLKALFVSLFLISFTASSAAFAGGSGTADDPYQIDNCRYLQDIRDNMDSHFEVVSDVDCSNFTELNSGNGFATLGAYSEDDSASNSGFKGRLDGNGHTISNLYIDRTTSLYLGLFSFIDQGGVVTDLKLESVDISGDEYLGAVAGYNEGQIRDVSVSGSVSGERYVGGIVGKNNGFLTDSYTMGTVDSETDSAGGLAGWNSGKIYLSYSTAAVEGERSGGITAMNSGTIARSFSTGSVKGEKAGGITGKNSYDNEIYNDGDYFYPHREGEIMNSYSSATIDGTSSGGAIGVNNGTVENVYATGRIYGGEGQSGGLVGERGSAASVSSSYYDEESTYSTFSAGGDDLLTEEMKKQSSFEGWDFSDVWSMPEDGYPQLDVNEYMAVLSDTDEVSVTSSDTEVERGLEAVKSWEGDLTGFRVSDIGTDIVYVSTVSGQGVDVTGSLETTRPESLSFSFRPDSGCEQDSCRSVSFLNSQGGTVFNLSTETSSDCGWYGCSTDTGYSFNGEYSEYNTESWTEFSLKGIDYEEGTVSEVMIGDEVLASDVSMENSASSITSIKVSSDAKTGGVYLKDLELEGSVEEKSYSPEDLDNMPGSDTDYSFDGSISGIWSEDGNYELSETSYAGQNSLVLNSEDGDKELSVERGISEGQKVTVKAAINETETSGDSLGLRIGDDEKYASISFSDGSVVAEGSDMGQQELGSYEAGKWYTLSMEVLSGGEVSFSVEPETGPALGETSVKASSDSEYSGVSLYVEGTEGEVVSKAWFDEMKISGEPEQPEEDPEDTGGSENDDSDNSEDDSDSSDGSDESDGSGDDSDDGESSEGSGDDDSSDSGEGSGSSDSGDESGGGIFSGIIGFLEATFS